MCWGTVREKKKEKGKGSIENLSYALANVFSQVAQRHKRGGKKEGGEKKGGSIYLRPCRNLASLSNSVELRLREREEEEKKKKKLSSNVWSH